MRMNRGRQVFGAAVLGVVLAGAGLWAAPETWTGKISDSMCGVSHGANGGTPEKDHACAVDCVKNMGATYVLVVDKKVFKIANQKFADLAKYAGQTVVVTGALKSDTITVSKVEPPKADR